MSSAMPAAVPVHRTDSRVVDSMRVRMPRTLSSALSQNPTGEQSISARIVNGIAPRVSSAAVADFVGFSWSPPVITHQSIVVLVSPQTCCHVMPACQ